ncbi:nuclear transcription factor Y subunit C-2-like isoform X2 [Asparagus officinalis]|uniref:nuclear transcription factor Y subunit C-2-like isoform X2 n=1 Tax=Asparagus officinalis TaxID=4686 RepID=UPI00098E7121|nr:nuclear transcription factor Y subunit C-2-like isoform X2 [Asparagus officinalis]
MDPAAPFMYNFMQVPTTPPPWANQMHNRVEQLPQSKTQEQLRKILEDHLTAFWWCERFEVDHCHLLELKQHSLPLARIKRIMKLDEEVKHQMRLTIRRCDIAGAVHGAKVLSFLKNIVPAEAMATWKMFFPEELGMAEEPDVDDYIISEPPPPPPLQ